MRGSKGRVREMPERGRIERAEENNKMEEYKESNVSNPVWLHYTGQRAHCLETAW